MDLLDILSVVRRRWKVASIAAVLGLALLVLASGAVEPDWDGTAIVAVDPPAAIITTGPVGEIISEPVNPITGGDAAAAYVPRLAVQATSQETRTTFAQSGLSTAYEIAYIQRQPYLTLTVTDGDPDLVAATLDGVIDFLELNVVTAQDEYNVDEGGRAQISVLAETEIAANQTNKRRVQGVIFVLTLVAAIAAALLTDLYFRRRDEADHADKYGPTDPPAVPTRPGMVDGDATPNVAKPNRWQRDADSG